MDEQKKNLTSQTTWLMDLIVTLLHYYIETQRIYFFDMKKKNKKLVFQ